MSTLTITAIVTASAIAYILIAMTVNAVWKRLHGTNVNFERGFCDAASGFWPITIPLWLTVKTLFATYACIVRLVDLAIGSRCPPRNVTELAVRKYERRRKVGGNPESNTEP